MLPLKGGHLPYKSVPPINGSSQTTSILSLYIPTIVPVNPKFICRSELLINTTLSDNL